MAKSIKIGDNRRDMNKKNRCPISGRHCNSFRNFKRSKFDDCLGWEAVITEHHIVPTSRGGSKTKRSNICETMKKFHRKYHDLFSNRTPLEILYFLEFNFWLGQQQWIDNYVKDLLEVKQTNKKSLALDYEKIYNINIKCRCPINNKYCRVLFDDSVDIKRDKHQEAYCDLFGDMTPTEILVFLEKTFWSGQKRWVKKYAISDYKFLSHQDIKGE